MLIGARSAGRLPATAAAAAAVTTAAATTATTATTAATLATTTTAEAATTAAEATATTTEAATAAAAATVTTAATTAEATTAAARAAAPGALLGQVHAERAAVERLAIHVGNRLLGVVGRGHRDERKATAATGLAVGHQMHVLNLSELFEHGAHRVGAGLEREVAYKQSVVHRRFSSRSQPRSLGFSAPHVSASHGAEHGMVLQCIRCDHY